jgi:hypothetical protein
VFTKKSLFLAGGLSLLAACTSTPNHTETAANSQSDNIFENRAPSSDSNFGGGMSQFQQLVLMAKTGRDVKMAEIAGSYQGTCYAVDAQNNPQESILTSISGSTDLGGDEGPTAGADDSPTSSAAPTDSPMDDSPMAAPTAAVTSAGPMIALDVVSMITLKKDREERRAHWEARREAHREARREERAAEGQDQNATEADDGFGGRRHGGGWHRHGRAWGRHGGCRSRKPDGSVALDMNCLAQRAQSLIQEDYKGGRYTTLTDSTTVTQSYDIEPNGNPDFATEARMVTKGDKTWILVTKTNVFFPGQNLILPIFQSKVHVVGNETFQACWFKNQKVAP